MVFSRSSQSSWHFRHVDLPVVIFVLSLRYGVHRGHRSSWPHSAWAWEQHEQRQKSERTWDLTENFNSLAVFVALGLCEECQEIGMT